MRRLITASILFMVLIASASANGGIISYLEGDVSIQKPGGSRLSAAIGDEVSVGDTIYTGADGFAEVALGDASSITIEAGSAFNVGEIADPEIQGGKKGFFRVLLGAVAFKFRGLDNEPDIGSPLSVCSVRGTDFTVYTGPDGASLTVVSDGLVKVTSGAQSAMLSAGEGVEAVVGLGLGEPFEAKTGFVKYEEFASQALNRMEEKPVEALEALTILVRQYADDGAFYYQSFLTNYEEIEAILETVVRIRDSEGKDKAQAYYDETLPPVRRRGIDLDSTYRFHLISGLQLRRYVVSSYYVYLRTRYLDRPEDPAWKKFAEAYEDFRDVYEEYLIPLLAVEDL